MPSQPVFYITGPNSEPEPVCLFPIPATADELISMEEWLENATAFAQSDLPPAPKPTEVDDGFDVDKATLNELWAYVVERNRKTCLKYAKTHAPKAKLWRRWIKNPWGPEADLKENRCRLYGHMSSQPFSSNLKFRKACVWHRKCVLDII